MIPTKERILDYLTSRLSSSRIAHSLGVEKTALKIAERFSLDPRKVSAAALLHDCAKGLSIEDQIRIGKQEGILSEEDLLSRGVIHARIGKQIAEQEFGIRDLEILNAILRHPTGYPGFGLFEKIIFASDYLEPGRKFKHRNKLLKRLEKDFEKGILTIAIEKLQYILNKPAYIHPDSILFYNWQFRLVEEGEKA